MASKGRRSSRALIDLPGLFDEIDPNITIPDPKTSGKKTHGAAPAEPAIDSPAAKPLQLLQFLSLGSGSSGNCAFLGVQGAGGILIDAGINQDKVLEMLAANSIPTEAIQAILLTHDHSDHVRFVYPLLRKLSTRQRLVPLYCTPRTLNGMLRRHSISKRITDHHKAIFHEFPFQAGPFSIVSFEVCHDGTDNSGFCISYADHNFVISGDMGTISDRADFYMRKANYLMIESDYDAAMLAAGPYPEHLKARIQRENGHLSNWATGSYLARMWQAHLSHIFLCHLSQENNRPELALRTCMEALTNKGIQAVEADSSRATDKADVRVSVLPRFEASPLHIFRIHTS